MNKRVLIATGGTGGHLLPAQRLAEQLQAQAEVLFGGYKLSDSPYFDRERFSFEEIRSASRLREMGSLLRGTWQAMRLIWRTKPDVVVGFGSYHSAPILLAAVLLRKKIVLFEANRTMGKVNRWIAPFAKGVGCQFPLPKATVVKPLSRVRVGTWTKQAAREAYGLDPNCFTLLVVGGSQGASFLNQVMPKVAERLPDAQVVHLAGNEVAAEQVREAYATKAHVKAFESEMAQAYGAADFVVCRSGAGTLSELTEHELPALLIPYPFAAGHQEMNAESLSECGGTVCLRQRDASIDAIVAKILDADRDRMRLALRTLSEQNRERIEFYELVLQI